jgi:hypothetical protein
VKGPVGCIAGKVENKIHYFAAGEDRTTLLGPGCGKRLDSLRDRTEGR